MVYQKQEVVKLRRILRKIAAGETDNFGDISTLLARKLLQIVMKKINLLVYVKFSKNLFWLKRNTLFLLLLLPQCFFYGELQMM